MVEGLEKKDFQIFRNEAVKLLRNIQSKAEEHGRQPQQPQQWTLSQSSSATLTYMPQTFQQPQQPAPAAREYILTIPETQMPLSQVIQPAQQSQVASKGQQQQSRGQPTSCLVIDNQQAGPSRPLTFTLMPMKHFNPPSVASATAEEGQHNISGRLSFLRNLQSMMSYQQIDTLQPFLPANVPASATSPPTTTSSQQHHWQPTALPPPPPQSADAKQKLL